VAPEVHRDRRCLAHYRVPCRPREEGRHEQRPRVHKRRLPATIRVLITSAASMPTELVKILIYTLPACHAHNRRPLRGPSRSCRYDPGSHVTIRGDCRREALLALIGSLDQRHRRAWRHQAAYLAGVPARFVTNVVRTLIGSEQFHKPRCCLSSTAQRRDTGIASCF